MRENDRKGKRLKTTYGQRKAAEIEGDRKTAAEEGRRARVSGERQGERKREEKKRGEM